MKNSLKPGKRLADTRTRLQLSLRDVGEYTKTIAKRLNDRRYVVPFSRLYEIETKGITPSVYRMYSLARSYNLELRQILKWYGIPI